MEHASIHRHTGSLVNEPEYNHSESIVLKLAKPLLKKGATIYADNFYSSLPLAEKLLQERTYYCGTVRMNRKMLPIYRFDRKKRIGYIYWFDRKKRISDSDCRGKNILL